MVFSWFANRDRKITATACVQAYLELAYERGYLSGTRPPPPPTLATELIALSWETKPLRFGDVRFPHYVPMACAINALWQGCTHLVNRPDEQSKVATALGTALVAARQDAALHKFTAVDYGLLDLATENYLIDETIQKAIRRTYITSD